MAIHHFSKEEAGMAVLIFIYTLRNMHHFDAAKL